MIRVALEGTEIDLSKPLTESMERDRHAAISLTGLCLAIALWLVFDIRGFGLAGAVCFALFLIVGAGRLRLRERYLMLLSVLAALAAISVLDDPLPLLGTAAIRSAYLAAFFLMLTLLRDGATTSTSVLSVGRWLTAQPPGRRYWALAWGGHILGVVMNFGALILLVPLVQRGGRDDIGTVPAEIQSIREQRQLNALARGFSWFIAWAPTSIAQVVVVSVVAGASALSVATMGAVIAASVVAAGWLDDRMTGRLMRRRLGGSAPPAAETTPPPMPALLRLFSVYGTLVILSAAIAIALGTGIVNGVVLASAPLTVLWIAMQKRAGRGDARSLSARLRDMATKTLPDCSPEAATLAMAGFIGTVLAAIVPPEALQAIFDLFGDRATLLYISLTATVVLASMIAMPPMLSVTFLGAAVSLAGEADLNPDLLALSLVLGWAINLTGSPFGATNLILSRLAGVGGARLAFYRNGRFSLWAFILCAIALWGFGAIS